MFFFSTFILFIFGACNLWIYKVHQRQSERTMNISSFYCMRMAAYQCMLRSLGAWLSTPGIPSSQSNELNEKNTKSNEKNDQIQWKKEKKGRHHRHLWSNLIVIYITFSHWPSQSPTNTPQRVIAKMHFITHTIFLPFYEYADKKSLMANHLFEFWIEIINE